MSNGRTLRSSNRINTQNNFDTPAQNRHTIRSATDSPLRGVKLTYATGVLCPSAKSPQSSPQANQSSEKIEGNEKSWFHWQPRTTALLLEFLHQSVPSTSRSLNVFGRKPGSSDPDASCEWCITIAQYLTQFSDQAVTPLNVANKFRSLRTHYQSTKFGSEVAAFDQCYSDLGLHTIEPTPKDFHFSHSQLISQTANMRSSIEKMRSRLCQWASINDGEELKRTVQAYWIRLVSNFCYIVTLSHYLQCNFTM